MAVERGRSHELVGSMVGAASSHVLGSLTQGDREAHIAVLSIGTGPPPYLFLEPSANQWSPSPERCARPSFHSSISDKLTLYFLSKRYRGDILSLAIFLISLFAMLSVVRIFFEITVLDFKASVVLLRISPLGLPKTSHSRLMFDSAPPDQRLSVHPSVCHVIVLLKEPSISMKIPMANLSEFSWFSIRFTACSRLFQSSDQPCKHVDHCVALVYHSLVA